MVQLLAYAPEDGWAFVQDGPSVFLLRPPYDGNRLAVGKADVERAVTVNGYLASERSFDTEKRLVDFLRDELIRSWPVSETPAELCEDLLQLATPPEIDVYLDEAEDWKTQGRYGDAWALFQQLFCAKSITFDQRRRMAAMMEQVSKAIASLVQSTQSPSPPRIAGALAAVLKHHSTSSLSIALECR